MVRTPAAAAAPSSSASRPARRPRLERHGVRMPGQPRARREDDVGLARTARRACRRARAAGPSGQSRPRRADGIRVHRLGSEALQSRDDGVGRAVADARRAERAVQRARHPRDPSSRPVSRRRVAKSRAARMGPTVWELEGPTPMENSSNAETYALTPPGYAPSRITRMPADVEPDRHPGARNQPTPRSAVANAASCTRSSDPAASRCSHPWTLDSSTYASPTAYPKSKSPSKSSA